MATAALKRKKLAEQELDRLAGTRLQIETQVSTLESANLNAETMAAMKKGADALKVIHNKVYVLFSLFHFEYQLIVVLVFRTIGKVDATMNEVNEQIEHAHEIAEALANPLMGPAIDEASCV